MYDPDIHEIQEHGLDISSRSIYLSTEKDTENSINFQSMYRFIKNLKFLDSINHDPIIFYAGSAGGDVEYGFGMYDAIKLAKSPVIFVGIGEVCSMLTIIMQAANLRLITENTYFLIHEGQICITESEPKIASSAVKSHRLTINKFYDIYLSRCMNGLFFKGKNDRSIKNHLKKQLMKKGDWYLEAEEVVHYGFADGILGQKPYESIEDILKSVYNITDDTTLITNQKE